MATQSQSQIHHTSTGIPYIPFLTTTGTFYLTHLYPSDASDMARIMACPEVYTRLQNPPYPYKLADAEWWIKTQIDTTTDHSAKELPFAALRTNDPVKGPYIGSCSLRPSPAAVGYRNTVLGYYLDPAYYGRGIMPAALRALIAHAFNNETPMIAAIIVQIADDNPASKSVLDKVGGFDKIGEETVQWPECKGGGKKNLISWRRNREA